MHKTPGSPVDKVVFWGAAAISASLVTWGALAPTAMATASQALLNTIIDWFGWSFVLSTAFFLGFALFLAFSRFGRIRLGKDDEEPEFSTSSWIAMMFSVGMGIGLMFWGVAEPITHFSTLPNDLAPPHSREAAKVAMGYAYFHWAFHPWAIYAIVGLVMAYFSFRKGLPNLISSAFTPLIGEAGVRGPLGKSIDMLAVLATLFGTATSLGLGAQQINSGLNYLWHTGESNSIALAIIAVMTVLFILSAVSGVGKGVQFLSNVNMVVAVLLLLFLAAVGPSVFIMNTLVASIGEYLRELVPMSFRTAAFSDGKWLAGWTIFYWAWWISWAPFVGTFIARISRGRTIREFVIGVIFIPSGVTMVWFAIMGGAALYSELAGAGGIAAAVNDQGPAVALFTLLGQYPAAALTSFAAIVLVGVFFISGADAGSIVMGMLCARGSLTPPGWLVVLWGTLSSAAASVLLVMGGLVALQTAAIIFAAPFLAVMVGLCVSLWKALLNERQVSVAHDPLAALRAPAPAASD
ncbi:BCCT family transporter [Metapseudomonas resinovorans]|uniref:BCCT family transporter n=1 Tax=Metapseudomonas resinovorans TaxID=53412 RepID=UPI0009842260|nr:BCCT family transporter [Pseudomonas resinovorans]GLZ86761.1 BCCT family transporter [Pseudomonas resinovorans]